MKERKNIEIDIDSRLYFPEEITVKEINDGRYLCVSVRTANWIVINKIQKEMLCDLIDGKTIQEVSDAFPNDTDNLLNKLLSSIMARKFATLNKDDIPAKMDDKSKYLNIYLTQACNLRCKHCFMLSGVKLKNELTASQWKNVLKDFKSIGGEYVTFTGGEVLMNPDFEDIVKYASSIGLSVTLLSNGVLWTDKLIDNLYGYVSHIQISLDGINEQTNASVRGKGIFDKVVENIIKIANRGYRTSVATTFTLENLTEETKFLYSKLVDTIREKTNNPIFFKISKKMLNGRNVHYTKEEAKRYFKEVINIQREVDKYAENVNFMDGHQPNFVSLNCGIGGLSISADGKVYYCNRISEVDCYGSVLDKPLSHFIEIGKEIAKKTDVDNIEPCNRCYLRYICCGGCRIDDFNFKGMTKQLKQGEIKRIEPMNECMARIEKKMIEGFDFLYDFN